MGERGHFYLSRALMAAMLAFPVFTLLVTACVPQIGDRFPRPVGIGRTHEGALKFIVPLCDGETISSFEVRDRETGELVWRVSRPERHAEENMTIILGDARGFENQDVSLKTPLPANPDVTAKLADGLAIASAFLVADVPTELSETGKVMNMDWESVSEQEFQRQVAAEYC